jgi:hypothetical protein
MVEDKERMGSVIPPDDDAEGVAPQVVEVHDGEAVVVYNDDDAGADDDAPDGGE